MKVNIEESWYNELKLEFEKPYFNNLITFIKNEISIGKIIYPSGKDIFNCFKLCPFQNVKVVIIGQDPYHGKGQANGLCFSVNNDVKIPPSLQNIFKELNNDLAIKIPTTGNLEKWANQGVLLLNAILTVEKDKAGSHQNKGWEIFTDKVIDILSKKKKNVVYILWGNYAQRKVYYISDKENLVLTSAHPSPLSANRGGFFNSNHFIKTNEYLVQNGIKPIRWNIE